MATNATGASKSRSAVRDYFANIGRAISSTFEGLAVTSSWLFRRPLTVQYPDRIEKPIQETLPDSYRGILEVDLDRCTGCLLCAKTCPIDCIDIVVEKNPETSVREIRKFDIDIGRCMYCGLCTEACKFDSLDHTTDFEASASSPEDLVLHFAREPKPVAKVKAGEGPARKPRGSILAKVVPPLFKRKRWAGKKREEGE
jgi:formate hydrogenlyase subunit 6/NADH:ubiquinone oxidoreductase subunit I